MAFIRILEILIETNIFSGDINHRSSPIRIIYQHYSSLFLWGIMNGLLIFLVLLLVILLYLLTAPFYIEVNSRKNFYGLRFHRLASAKIYATPESVYIELQIAGWHKVIDLLVKKEKRVKKTVRPETKKTKGISISKVRALIASFKISKCYISLDTGDMALNGILYPWFLWIRGLTRKNISINFYNENEIVLEIENNFFRVLRAYISH